MTEPIETDSTRADGPEGLMVEVPLDALAAYDDYIRDFMTFEEFEGLYEPPST